MIAIKSKPVVFVSIRVDKSVGVKNASQTEFDIAVAEEVMPRNVFRN